MATPDEIVEPGAQLLMTFDTFARRLKTALLGAVDPIYKAQVDISRIDGGLSVTLRSDDTSAPARAELKRAFAVVQEGAPMDFAVALKERLDR